MDVIVMTLNDDVKRMMIRHDDNAY